MPSLMQNYRPNKNFLNLYWGIVDEVPIYKLKFMEYFNHVSALLIQTFSAEAIKFKQPCQATN